MQRYVAWVMIAFACLVAPAAAQVTQRGPMPRELKPQWQRMLIGEDAKRSSELDVQIEAAVKAEKWDEAFKLAEQVLALRTRVQGKDHWQVRDAKNWLMERKQRPFTAESRNRLMKAVEWNHEAVTLFEDGRYADALPVAERCLKTYQEVLGDKDPDVALILSVLGSVHSSMGRYALAERALRDALRICQGALGDQHPDTARALNNLGLLYSEQGRNDQAEPLYWGALRICRDAWGDKHPHTAASLINLAVVYRAQGKYTLAEPLNRDAVWILKDIRGVQHLDTASALDGLGTLYLYQGRYAEAEQLYRDVLRIRKELLGEKHSDTATSLNNLAAVYEARDRYAEAVPLFRDALRICQDALGDHHRETAIGLHNLGAALNAQGKYAEAEPLCRLALKVVRDTLGDRHPDTLDAMSNIGITHAECGRYAQAEPVLRDALRLSQDALGDQHPDTARCLNSLAALYLAQGHYEKAQPCLVKCVQSYEASRLIRGRPIERAVANSRNNPYPDLAATLAHLGKPTEGYRALEADLARGLLDEQAVRTGKYLLVAEQKLRTEVADRLLAVEAQMLRIATKPNQTAAERSELSALTAGRRRDESLLARLAADLSRREIADPARIAAAIEPATALIAWVDSTYYAGRVQEHWACVVRRTGDPEWEILPPAGPGGTWTKDDDDLTSRLRSALHSSTTTTAEFDALVAKVRAQRVTPIVKHLNGVKRLLVVGTNHMAGIPVELLAPEYQVEYVPSGTAVVRAVAKPQPAGEPSVLAVGDPVFPPPGPAKDPPLPPGGVLIQSVVEGGAAFNVFRPGDVLLAYGGAELADGEALDKAIAASAQAKTVPVRVWRITDTGEAITRTVNLPPRRLGVTVAKGPARDALLARHKTDQLLAGLARSGRIDLKTGHKKPWAELPGTAAELDGLKKLFGDRATVLTRSQANEVRLDGLRAAGKLRAYRYLHFATHGLANDDRAFESFLALSQDNLPRYEGKEGEKPFNGELSAREVLNEWKLDNCDLVTLSACESGLGRSAGGDGLLGFVQAFLVAGARSVCVSLWKVDDTATTLLMDRFYRNLLGKRDGLKEPMRKGAALREAKNWLKEATAEEVLKLSAEMTNGVTRGKGEPLPPVVEEKAVAPKGDLKVKPYADPRYWAAFILVGDPD